MKISLLCQPCGIQYDVLGKNKRINDIQTPPCMVCGGLMIEIYNSTRDAQEQSAAMTARKEKSHDA